MSTVDISQEVAEAQLAVTKQGDTVRSLKASLKTGNAEKVNWWDPYILKHKISCLLLWHFLYVSRLN